MKKLIISLFLALSLPLFAQNATSDCFTVSDVTLSPDGTSATMVVSLSGSIYYSGYNLDIQLPEGVSVALKRNSKPDVTLDNSDDIYDDHTISASIIANNTLRVACVSFTSSELYETSGKLFKVVLTASAYAKPGLNSISLSGQNLSTAAAVKYVPTDVAYSNITVSETSVELPLTISSSNLWSTCVLPFNADLPSGVSAYTISQISNDKAYLQSAASFAAYTPYLVYAPAGFSGNVSGTPSETSYNILVENGVANTASNLLNGAIASQSITSGYVLQNQGDGAKFYMIDGETFVINPGKCWMKASDASHAPAIVLTTEEPSAIESVDGQLNADGPVYNLQGMQVSEMVPGQVYIQNGQKFIKL